jgi:predicted HTH domain antitoxin
VSTAYLDGDISLGRAALLLGLSRFELQAHFNRLGLPAQPGPLSLNEARAEYTTIQTDQEFQIWNSWFQGVV